ncbi:hypothetical protein P7C73_g1205, partial [Tremellales sp. Uapishka_1]
MLPSAVFRSRATSIGWIGLGAMGHPMATNLFLKTHAHQQTNSAAERTSKFLFCEKDDARAELFCEGLREKGGVELYSMVERVGSGKEMSLAASKIITMLPSTPQVEAVYLDPDSGILAGMTKLFPKLTSRHESGTPHTLLIDQTTLDPTKAIEIAERVHQTTQYGALMLDAPVSGGTSAAASGLLTIMFGSPSPLATSLALPLLRRMARENGVIDCGKNGLGVGVKVCNNLILAINQIALAEGLALGRSLGIDPLLLHDIINSSSGQSWSSKVNSPLTEVATSPGSRGYSGGFQSRLMLKDVGLALHAAHKFSLPTPLTWAASSVYDSVCKEGDGAMASKDFSIVYEWLKKKQEEGVEVGWKE